MKNHKIIVKSDENQVNDKKKKESRTSRCIKAHLNLIESENVSEIFKYINLFWEKKNLHLAEAEKENFLINRKSWWNENNCFNFQDRFFLQY